MGPIHWPLAAQATLQQQQKQGCSGNSLVVRPHPPLALAQRPILQPAQQPSGAPQQWQRQ